MIEPRTQLLMVVCWNLITLCTDSHGDPTWIQLEEFLLWSTDTHRNKLILILPYFNFSVEKLVGIIIFSFHNGKSYELQSIKTAILTCWNLACIAKKQDQIDMHKLKKKYRKFNLTVFRWHVTLGHQNATFAQETDELLWYLVCV